MNIQETIDVLDDPHLSDLQKILYIIWSKYIEKMEKVEVRKRNGTYIPPKDSKSGSK